MARLAYMNFKKLLTHTHDICRQVNLDEWRPDYIVGIVRGGMLPAKLISHYYNLPMYTLDIRLRQDSGTGPESNERMARDAYGYSRTDHAAGIFSSAKNILIVDDINDSGATFIHLQKDWQNTCNTYHANQGCEFVDDRWNDVWGENVRFAVIVENTSSEFKGVTYYSKEINKLEDDVWIVFPWEEWWTL